MPPRRSRTGRPPEPLPDGIKVARPHLRLSETEWAALERTAERAMRDLSHEVAMALGAYLDAHPTLPPPLEADLEHERRRVRLQPAVLQRLDDRAGIDDRERHIIAAVRWWLGN